MAEGKVSYVDASALPKKQGNFLKRLILGKDKEAFDAKEYDECDVEFPLASRCWNNEELSSEEDEVDDSADVVIDGTEEG